MNEDLSQRDGFLLSDLQLPTSDRLTSPHAYQRDLRSLILHWSATYVWRSAFTNSNNASRDGAEVASSAFRKGKLVGLPSCPEGMQLPKWASLIWDTFCHVRTVLTCFLTARWCRFVLMCCFHFRTARRLMCGESIFIWGLDIVINA